MARRAYFQENQRVVGNRNFTLKGHTQILKCSGRQGRSSNLKWSDPPADLGESPIEAGGKWSSPRGHGCWRQPFWELVLPEGHWCWQGPFWNPPSSLLALGPAPSISLLAPVLRMPQAKQLVRWRHRATYQQAGCLKTP